MRTILGVEDPITECGKPPYLSRSEDGRMLMDRLLQRTSDFSAVVCTNDLMAYGAMLSLRNHGMDIPGRVSVVGIDDIKFSGMTYPPLTTLSHCCEEYGRRIFRILMDNIQNKNLVRRDVIKPKLIVRESTSKCNYT